ncbi:MAG: hypothetical protein ACYC6Y_30015 [Thermoguttaceae bacterium]
MSISMIVGFVGMSIPATTAGENYLATKGKTRTSSPDRFADPDVRSSHWVA